MRYMKKQKSIMKENREKDNAEPETLFGEIERREKGVYWCLGRNNVGCVPLFFYYSRL